MTAPGKWRRYFTLAVREDGVWAPQWGDYDRAAVVAELEDYRDHDVKRKDLKIVVSGDAQDQINAAIARLNDTERLALRVEAAMAVSEGRAIRLPDRSPPTRAPSSWNEEEQSS